jgi:TRAP-type C4-dicarboxylate transport system substrate-binding protein
MLKSGIAAALGLAIASVTAQAQTVLRLNSPAPPPSYLHKGVFEPWAAAVEADAGGTIKFQMSYGGQLGNFGVAYDRMIDGVSDIAFILTGLTGGRFKQQDVASLPFETRDSNEAAIALWKLYEKGITADEFKQVKLLGTWAFPNASIHSMKPIATLADLKGNKFSVGNAILGSVIVALGSTPVSLRPDETYQALSRGTVEGVVMPFTGMYTFKLHEVAKSHLDVPLGADAAALVMNRQKFESLPPQARAAIDKHSGLLLTQKLGTATQGQWDVGHQTVKEKLTRLAPDEEKKWQAALAPIAQKWAESAPNGKKVLEAFRAEVQAVRK